MLEYFRKGIGTPSRTTKPRRLEDSITVLDSNQLNTTTNDCGGGNDQHKTTHSNDEGELVLREEGMERIDERFVSHDIKRLGVVVSAVDTTRSKRCNE